MKLNGLQVPCAALRGIGSPVRLMREFESAALGFAPFVMF
jgi:hypothetical protein